jgi:hypothetical protein
MITYEMSRLNAKPNRAARAKEHFDRAGALGGGHQAGPLVAYAENVFVAQKNKAEFQNTLRQALRLDINASPANYFPRHNNHVARALACSIGFSRCPGQTPPEASAAN